MRRNAMIILFAAVVAAAFLCGCNSGGTKISSILNDPERYIDKDTTIAGNVTKSYAINLVVTDVGAYQVDDGTGKIWVISRNDVPANGTQVGVKGRVSRSFKLGGESLATVLRETERRTR